MMPILPTPITPDGDIDEPSLRRLVQYALACKAAAIGHLAIASEFFKLTEDQRNRVIEVTVDETAGRVPVFIGVTSGSDHVSVHYARQAQQRGADLLMSAPPFINMHDAAGTYDYYKRLNDATSLPIIVQDTPQVGAILSPAMMKRMLDELEHIRYVKAEGNDFLTKSATLFELGGSAMPVIGGAGGRHMLQMLRIGVTSFMTGTEALDIHAAVVRHYLAGDEKAAADVYYDVLLPYFVFYDSYPEHLLKDMLHMRGVIDCPKVIPPAATAPMSRVARGEFLNVLDRIGFLDKRWPDIG